MGGLIGNENADKITNVPKSIPKNNLEIVESETETPKERYISPEEMQQIIDELRLI